MFDKENGINLKTTLDLKLEDCFFLYAVERWSEQLNKYGYFEST